MEPIAGGVLVAGRDGGGYELESLRANCMGDSLLAVVDATDRSVCHLGYRTCFSHPVEGDPATRR